MISKYVKYCIIFISIIILYSCKYEPIYHWDEHNDTTIEKILKNIAFTQKKYEPIHHWDEYNDPTIREILKNIELNQKESNNFAEIGQNKYSNYLNISLFLCALFTSITAIIQGTKNRNKAAKQRLILLLSIFATVFSSAGFYVKSESERFYKENRDKYISLSLEMNEQITQFYLQFTSYNSESNPVLQIQKRNDLIFLSKKTLGQLDSLKKDYNEKYHINTNIII